MTDDDVRCDGRRAMTLAMIATVQLATAMTLMTTLGWQRGHRRHQAYPHSSQWGDEGGIAMTMAGGGLGFGFGGDSSRGQPPPAVVAKRQRLGNGGRPEATTNEWRGPKMPHNKPTNGGAQREAEALAERRRQANGQHDNQRSSGGDSAVAIKRRGAD